MRVVGEEMGLGSLFTPLVIVDIEDFMCRSLPDGLGTFWFSLEGFKEIFRRKMFAHEIDPNVGLPAMSYYFELETIFHESTTKWLIKAMADTGDTVQWSQEIYGHIENYKVLIEAINSIQGKASEVVKSIKSKSNRYYERIIMMACREVFKEWLQVQYIAVPIKLRFEVLQDLENWWFKHHPDEQIFKMRELSDFNMELQYKKKNQFRPLLEKPRNGLNFISGVLDKTAMFCIKKCPPLIMVIPFLLIFLAPIPFFIAFILYWTWFFSH
ncbi:hypothetical protein [Morchella esculenta fusarivirus 1]|uniref:Uncharacterized protein n=1 Tax=Morchella esculenta fusarivirus 1 TaxID=2830906 RepID=A0AAE7RBP4_9VIRU|nr:hypothetical protein [Morchella esculenta fusarivirus 1]